MARYRHPKHGLYIVGYGDDLAALKAAGWVLDEPAPASPVPALEFSPTPAPVAALKSAPAYEPAKPPPSPQEPAAPAVEAAPQPVLPTPRREWRPKRGR